MGGAIPERSGFYRKLSGNGRDGGQRWRLVFVANKKAVSEARKGNPPSLLDRGWYVDSFVTAVQRFEDSTRRVNENGVFEFLGLGGFFFGYIARFKWPSPKTGSLMGFQPTQNIIRIFGREWISPFAGAVATDSAFEEARMKDLNLFNFVYVDDDVAVAQGQSGSVALWSATDSEW